MHKFSKKLPFLLLSFLLASPLFTSCLKPGDGYVNQAAEANYARDYKKAVALLEEALAKGTSYSPEFIYTLEAKAYLGLEDYENAAIVLEKAMAAHPDYMQLNQLAKCYRQTEKYDLAEQTLKRAIEFAPNQGEAYAELGSIYIKQNKVPEAIQNLEIAVSKLPNHNIVHANLALAYAMDHQKEKSDAELKKAEELLCPNIGEFKARIAEFN